MKKNTKKAATEIEKRNWSLKAIVFIKNKQYTFCIMNQQLIFFFKFNLIKKKWK